MNWWKVCGRVTSGMMPVVYILLMLIGGSNTDQITTSAVQTLTDENWERMLTGEWLVKFYAPWCPACQSLGPVWENLGRKSIDMNVKIGDVDVTENAALSGKFFVTSLPTIYHVKDGVFRQYKRSRTEADLTSFVVDRKWSEVEPVAWYLAPNSYPMRVVGVFFQGSIAIRNLHTRVTTDYGIPVWCSYVLIAVITLLIGLALGLGCVCLCDMLGGHSADSHEVVVDDTNDDVLEGNGSGDKKSDDEKLQEEGSEDVEEDDEDDMIIVDRSEVEGGGEGGTPSTRRRNIPQ